MGIEYHGWFALSFSDRDLDDGQIEDAFQQVEQLLAELDPEQGHWGLITGNALLPRMVYLNGSGVESLISPKDVITRIAASCDGSYGELIAFDADCAWPPSSIDRYTMANGVLTRGAVKR